MRLAIEQFQFPSISFKKRINKFIFLLPLLLLLGALLYYSIKFYASRKRIQVVNVVETASVNVNEAEDEGILNFERIIPSFYKFNFNKFSKLDIQEWERRILMSIPVSMRENAKYFIKPALELSEKHNVDPFWTLSILWTESHFRRVARSPAGARGPMQLMPKTKKYLHRVIKREGIELSENRNLEIGIIYLKKLLKRFKHNPTYATVAYNMGPTRISKWLKKRKPVGKRNLYLRKVKRAYRKLTTGFTRARG